MENNIVNRKRRSGMKDIKGIILDVDGVIIEILDYFEKEM